jgi:hypothetical protein
VAKVHYFVKKKVPNNIVKGFFFEKNPKKLTYFKEESYEIAKKFGGFGQIYSFFLLKFPYLAIRF